MSDPEKDDLEETRAALAPTLEATAAILPWVAKPKQPRFPPEASKHWQEVCDRLAATWSDRHESGLAGLRPAVFELCGAALELHDLDCLRLTEALASATDHLEDPDRMADARLVAALSATFECLGAADHLEHDAFPERARHFAARLEKCADPALFQQSGPLVRTPVIDRLFASEAGECLDRIHEAFAVLPPDAYGIKLAADDLAHLAEPLELDEISALADCLLRLLTPQSGSHVDLDDGETRASALALVAELEQAIAAVSGD